MDKRDMTNLTGKWYLSIDEDKMVATVDLEEDEIEIEIPFRFEICPTQ